MKYRKRVSRRSGRRDFTRTASAVNRRNTPRHVVRGGTRL